MRDEYGRDEQGGVVRDDSGRTFAEQDSDGCLIVFTVIMLTIGVVIGYFMRSLI